MHFLGLVFWIGGAGWKKGAGSGERPKWAWSDSGRAVTTRRLPQASGIRSWRYLLQWCWVKTFCILFILHLLQQTDEIIGSWWSRLLGRDWCTKGVWICIIQRREGCQSGISTGRLWGRYCRPQFPQWAICTEIAWESWKLAFVCYSSPPICIFFLFLCFLCLFHSLSLDCPQRINFSYLLVWEW